MRLIPTGRIALTALTLALAAGSAWSQSCPNKPVRLVIAPP